MSQRFERLVKDLADPWFSIHSMPATDDGFREVALIVRDAVVAHTVFPADIVGQTRALQFLHRELKRHC